MLQCSRCREADWYSLDELEQVFVCHRCKQRQTIQQNNWKEGAEPAWFYKLDEIIYQGVKNNMALPILSLAYIKKKAKSSFLFVPELEFRRDPEASKPEREVDICCIQDGKIILGECRTSSISKELINKLNSFSSSLMKFPDELVFATLSSKISGEITSHAKSTLPVPFIILSDSDLMGVM